MSEINLEPIHADILKAGFLKFILQVISGSHLEEKRPHIRFHLSIYNGENFCPSAGTSISMPISARIACSRE
jgi:hypothetical protein